MAEGQKTPKPRRIRPVSRETRFLRLRGLKCFKELHQRLLEGWAPSKVAQFVQEDRKEYTDIGRASLETQLSEYRASLPPGEVVKERLPRFHAEQAEKVEKGFDELAEMEKLYDMQLKRIEIDAKIERGVGKLMPSMTQEIRTAREILSGIAQLKMDLGVNERHLGKMEVEAQVVQDVTKNYDPNVGKVMEKPESRRKLLGLAERFMSLASGRANVDGENSPAPAVNAAKVAPEPELVSVDTEESDS